MSNYTNQKQMCIVGKADIYIPRINRERASFSFIGSVFVQQEIGYVEYIDFVEINANHQSTAEANNGEPIPFEKHPTLVSAFLRVVFWDQKTLDAIRNPPNLRKLYLYSYSEEHWLLLPNKTTPIDRTILNIHQVAHYTAEVQTKTADIAKVMDGIIQQNKELAQSVEMLLKQNSIMRAEIEELKANKSGGSTVISIVHNAHDNTARKLTSDCLCGNA
jgi:hypothetical protein